MRPGPFFWKLFLANAALVGLVLGVAVWFIVAEFDRFHESELTAHLRTLATSLEPGVRDRFDVPHRNELDALVKEIGAREAAAVRITLVATDGTVLGDSQANLAVMESHAQRPEIREALRKGWGASTRWSSTVSNELKYVAVRVGPEDAPFGVVRTAMAVQTIGARLQSAHHLMWAITLTALVAAVVLALGLAGLWSERIRRITATAESLSRGDLSARLNASGSDEVAVLARSLNQMRDHLAGQLAMIDRQRRVLELLLGQLQEGVVVAGSDGRIVLINPAGAKLLDLGTAQGHGSRAFEGCPVEQCVGHEELRKMLLADPQATDRPGHPHRSDTPDGEVQLQMDGPSGDVTVLARASNVVLPRTDEANSTGEGVGRLLALTDITELTAAIRMKTDFVANASHELRTPLSAIRAAIETLCNMDLAAEAASARRFLDVVDRHSARLEAMVADLLDLSRLESASSRLDPAVLSVQRVVAHLYERWAEPIRDKGIQWHSEIEADCDQVLANAHLLQLVLDNLVDNALKFTERGGRVEVLSRCSGDAVAVTVADTGCGIPPDEQQRVFERFYQVAPARSGTGSPNAEARGTGLGLSIVRHAVAALNGTVALESTLGEGTRVTVTIPRAP